MPVATANEFFKTLEKSRLVPAERLAQLRETAGDSDDGKTTAVRLVKEGVLSRWQAGALLAGNANLTIGKYHLLSQLGTGKSGRVFLGCHADMGRQVALKILPRRADASATNLQQFMEQARAVSALDHPNLIHTYDVDSEADQFYLVMEYFPGDDLQTLVEKEGPLGCARAADIIRQAAEGLAHAAGKGMTHGDVRPNSIAVDSAGRVKVLHLGLLELAGPSLRTLEESDPSSADYAAPEYRGGNATPLSDVYSLGCVLYFLLSGQPPFGDGAFAERRRQHQSLPPAVLTAKRAEVPADLARICQKMMAKTPANRVPSAQEVATLLSAWLQKNPLPGQNRSDSPSDKKLRPAEPLANSAAAASPASEQALPSFNFGEKKKSKPSATPSQREETRSTTATPAATDTQPAEKKPLSKGLLIGLGAGGGLALLAVVGVAAIFLLGGNDDQGEEVAQAPAAQQAAPEPEIVDGNVLEEETLEGDLFSSSDPDEETNTSNDAEASEPSSAAAASDGDKATDAAEPVDAPNSQMNAADPSSAGETLAATDTSSTEPQPPAPSEEPSSPPPDQPTATTPPPTADTPPAAPAPAQPPAEKPKPKEPEKKKPADPFADLKKTALTLPSLGEGAEAAASLQPAALAVVHDDPEAGCFLRLAGGDVAHKGKEIFTLEPDDQGYRNRAWTIFVGLGDSGEINRAPIAKLALDEKDNLNFQWTPQASEQNAANYLRNCLLDITIGDKSKEIPLREPTVVEPLVVSLDKGGTREQFDLEWAPDPEQLQLEITSLEGPFPKHNFDPSAAIKAAGGRTAIMFGDPPNQLMMLEVRATMTRKLGVTLAPFLKVGNQPVKLTLPGIQQAFAQASAQYQQLNNMVTQKIGPAQRREQMEQLLPQQAAIMQGYGELAEKASALNNTGKVHFRVFFLAGQRQVDVLKSGAGAAPAGLNPPANAGAGAPAGE